MHLSLISKQPLKLLLLLLFKAGNTVELDSSALSSGRLNPVQGTPHEHTSKLIGDNFPQNGYGQYSQ